jgi:hypothetical protein
MKQSTSSSTADVLFLALKGLAAVAELAMIAGVIYAAATAARYWPSINV